TKALFFISVPVAMYIRLGYLCMLVLREITAIRLLASTLAAAAVGTVHLNVGQKYLTFATWRDFFGHNEGYGQLTCMLLEYIRFVCFHRVKTHLMHECLMQVFLHAYIIILVRCLCIATVYIYHSF
ncbi:hypothetical protein ACJX0J_030221, partial [Zea mays]